MLYYKDSKSITVYFANGDVALWSNTHPSFNRVYQLCKECNWAEIEVLYNLNKAIINSNSATVNDNTININNVELKDVNTPLTNFIKLLQKKGVIQEKIDAAKPFFINMFQNQFIDAVTEIYDFCKAMDFEITDDGCFLAYKKVRNDLGSVYDNGTTKHEIGKYTEVKLYDTERTNTCSNGLHFCSKSYLDCYPGDKIIIVKVNPKDVVSIPVDYNFAKGRCRKYMTVGILDNVDKMLKDVKVNELVGVNNIIRVNDEMIPYCDRIEATAYWMKVFDNNKDKVAERMNIKVSTVERNMREYEYRKKNKSNK